MIPGRRNTADFSVFVVRLFVFVAIIGLASCPRAIDMALVNAVEDSLSPSITVITPKANDHYTSTVLVEGIIADDSLSHGDAQGLIQSISYDVANDDFRRGKIIITSDGNAIQDPAGGTGTITWDDSSGMFSFEFSTINPILLNGPLYIDIEVTDLNNNVTIKQLPLLESPGPHIVLDEPGNTITNFREGSTHILICGTVSNSSTFTTSADEVKTLYWSVSGQPWQGTLDLDGSDGSDDLDPGGSGLYISQNEGFLYPEDFVFDPAALPAPYFETGFDVPWGVGSIIPIVVSATDKNGHTKEVGVVLYSSESGPQITIFEPSTNPSILTYYSPNNYSAPWISGNVFDFSTVALMKYRVEQVGVTFPDEEVYRKPSAFFDGVGNFEFEMDAVSLAGQTGTFKVTIIALNEDNRESRPYFYLYEDPDPPDITPVAISSNNANSDYARVGDTVSLIFEVSDDKSGVYGKPAVSIAGHLIPEQDVVFLGNDQYQATYTMQNTDVSDVDVSFEITATDIAGNGTTPITASTDGSKVMFYRGAPTMVANSVGITSTTNPSPVWAKVGDTVELSFTSDRDLSGDPVVTIAGHASPWVSLDVDSAPVYTATYEMQSGDAQAVVAFTIDFTDAAANVGTPITAITTGSNVTFDETPPTIGSASFTPTAGWRGVGDTITMRIVTTSDVFGGLVEDTISINGQSSPSYIYGFTDNSNGTYDVIYKVAEGDSDRADTETIPISVVLADPAGNTNPIPFTTTATFDVSPAIDAHEPVITGVAFKPTSGWHVVGDAITMGITTSGDPTGGLVANAISINGQSSPSYVYGFTDNGNGTYDVTYEVAPGDPDVTANDSIPISVILADPAGNTNSLPFTSSPASTSCPEIDTHAPAISGVTFNPSSGTRIISQSVTLTINVVNGETGLSPGAALDSITVNGVPVKSTWNEVGGGSYEVEYTVATDGSDPDVNDATQALPISIVLRDPAGNESSVYTTSTVGGSPGVDSSTEILILSRETQDSDGNGQIDRIRMTADSPLNDSFSGFASLVSGHTVGGYNTGASANDAVFNILIDESGSEDTGDLPTVEITANTTLSHRFVGVKLVAVDVSGPVDTTDAAAPALRSATLSDEDHDGRIDAVELRFSEDVDDSSFVASHWTFDGNAGTGIDTGTSTDDDTVSVLYGTDDLGIDTSAGGAAIVFLYGTSAEDTSGNQLAAIGNVSETDGAAPVMVSAIFSDEGTSGVDAGDTITITFSETLASVGGVSASDFTLPVNNDDLGSGAAFAKTGGGALRITLGSSPTLEPTGTYDGTTSSGSSSGINLITNPSGTIEDGSGNNATKRTGTGKNPEGIDI